MFNTYYKTENKNNSLIFNICNKHIKAKICKIQLSHSMSVPKINGYARIQGKTTSLETAKLAIFSIDILWGSCSKYDL